MITCWNNRTLFETCGSTSSLQPPPDSANLQRAITTVRSSDIRPPTTTTHHITPHRSIPPCPVLPQLHDKPNHGHDMATTWQIAGESQIFDGREQSQKPRKSDATTTHTLLAKENEHMKKRCQTKQKMRCECAQPEHNLSLKMNSHNPVSVHLTSKWTANGFGQLSNEDETCVITSCETHASKDCKQ